MLVNLRSLLCAAVAALGLLASTAAAEPVLTVAGPPAIPGASTSYFAGDLSSATGALVLDDMLVVALEYGNGATQHYSTGSDGVLGAEVELIANFTNGVLSGAGNFLHIHQGGTTLFLSDIAGASLSYFGGAFGIFLSSGGTFGGPLLGLGLSDWIDENQGGMQAHGLTWSLTAFLSGQSQNGRHGIASPRGQLTPNPEPGTLALFGLAALGGLIVRRRRRLAAKASA